MKRIIYTTVISGISIVLIACTSPSQKVETAKTDLKEARLELNQSQKDSVADYEQFRSESEEQIRKNEIAIQAFKDRMATDKKHAKAADQKMIDELEQRNINMRKKIADYKENGKDEWSAFKVEFSHDMDELANAVKGLTVKHTN